MSAPHTHETTEPPPEPALRVKALESLLTERGLVDPAAIDAIIDLYENKVGPHNGARVVARAWVDPAFKQWLLADGSAAMASMGYSAPGHEHITVLENTASGHNLVVCTSLLLLPVAGARAAARVVQVRALSSTSGGQAAIGAATVRDHRR